MKQTLLLFLIMAFTGLCYGQYDSAAQYRMATPTFSVAMDTLIARATSATMTGEGSPAATLERYKRFMGTRISYDVPLGGDMTAPMGAALRSYMSYVASCPSSGNWSCLGPFNSYYGTTDAEQQGRINAIWVNPVSGSILAGADGGGLWQTYNDGHTWHCLTNGVANSILGLPGINAIAVNPLDTNIIYIQLGNTSQYQKSLGYNLGIAYTTDGGANWNEDTAFNNLANGGLPANVTKIAYMPGTSRLFALTLFSENVYYKPSPTSAWQDISPSGMVNITTDLQFNNLPPVKAIVTASAAAGTSQIWEYNPTSATWGSPINMTLFGHTQGYRQGPMMFSISGADTAYMAFATTIDTLLLKTPLNTFFPTIINTNFDGPTGIFQQIYQFVVSPSNPNIIYLANYDGEDGHAIYKSTDGGHTFPYSYATHADGRCVFVASTTNTTDGINDHVFTGNDGGIREKRIGNNNFDCITGDSLAVTEFYGFGNTEANENIMSGGAQDVGEFAYVKANSPAWSNLSWPGGDGNTSKFMHNGVTSAFGEGALPGRVLYEIDFSGSGFSQSSVSNPPTDAEPITRPIYFNTANEAFLGCEHIWRKSVGATSWSNAFNSPGFGDPIDQVSGTKKEVSDFYIDAKDTAIAYIAYKDQGGSHPESNDTFARLYFTNKAGNTPPAWVNITPSICNTNNINSIAVDPNHIGRIWVAFGNINSGYVGANPDTMKNRVWYSSDTGNSWTDVSTGLSALPVNKLLYRKGSNDEIFAGTDVGIFKWNPATSSWQCYNNGLPACIVMDMEFNYCANKLRAATYGRGIWETPLDTLTNIPDSMTTVIIPFRHLICAIFI